MNHYDCLLIGGGFTGSALGYELARQGFRVLLLEKDPVPYNATRFSYGGLAYWSGSDPTSKQICQEGIEIHRQLSDELGYDTEFREIDLLLTVNPEDDPFSIAQNYQKFAIAPEILSVQEACSVEPLLNPEAIGGALKLSHAHIHPQKTNQAYQKAFKRLGGEIHFEPVVQILQENQRVLGAITPQQSYQAAHTIVCAGGLTRQLLRGAGINIPQYFTYAQLVLTPPILEQQLNTLIMSAVPRRLLMERAVITNEEEESWNNPTPELIASAFEAGAVQFQDKSFCLGQISQIIRDPNLQLAAAAAESQIRQGVGKILPALKDLPGLLYQCLVAFAHPERPLVGPVAHIPGLYLFSGFTSTLIFAPPLARRLAQKLNQPNSP